MMENESVLFRMKWWKWFLLLFFSVFGMMILSDIAVMLTDEAEGLSKATIFAVAGSVILCAVYGWLSSMVEKRNVYELRFRRFFPDMGSGWLVGGGAMVLSVLVMWVAGVYHMDSISCPWSGIAHGLVFFLVVAVGEEIYCRAVLLRMVEERWGTTVALVVSCLFFGFMHYFNDGATVWSCVALAVTAVEAASFIYSRSLWMPIGTHWAWNFIQGNVLGINVSGFQMEGSFIHATFSGPELLTGGAFGAEASIITVVVSTSIAAGLIWLAYKKGNYLPFRCPWRRR